MRVGTCRKITEGRASSRHRHIQMIGDLGNRGAIGGTGQGSAGWGGPLVLRCCSALLPDIFVRLEAFCMILPHTFWLNLQHFEETMSYEGWYQYKTISLMKNSFSSVLGIWGRYVGWGLACAMCREDLVRDQLTEMEKQKSRLESQFAEVSSLCLMNHIESRSESATLEPLCWERHLANPPLDTLSHSLSHIRACMECRWIQMNTLEPLQTSLDGSCVELASHTAVEEPARNSAEREVWAANPSRHGWIWPFSFGTQSREGCVDGLLGQHGLNCFDFFGQLLTSQLVHTQPYDLGSLFGSGRKKMFHFVSEQLRRPFEEGIERLRSFEGQVGSGPKWISSPARRGRDLEKGECSTQS